MPLDPSISLQTKGIDLTHRLSSFLDIGRKGVALDRETATLAADIDRAKYESARAGTEADVAARTADPRVSQAQSVAGSAAANMSIDKLNEVRAHLSNSAQEMTGLRDKEDLSQADIIASMTRTAAAQKAPRAALLQGIGGIPESDDPEILRRYILQNLNKVQSAGAQLDRMAPPVAMVPTGGETVPVTTGSPELAVQTPGAKAGPGIRNTLPPTATTMRGNQPVYLGAPPGGQPGTVPSGPGIGQTEGITGPVQVATKHYGDVTAAAEAAPTRIASLQTIKQEAPAAVTGGGDYRRKILQQLSGLFGIANDEQTANDVMAKNLAVIAGQAGNTDASRALAEMGSPNYHMTKDAIEQTANQLIGIERKKIAAQQFFSGLPTNDPQYTARMVEWNKLADPRLFEFASMTPSEQFAAMSKLKPGVRADLILKSEALHKLSAKP